MVHIRRLPILLAAATLAWAPAVFSASPSTDAEHEQHHPKEEAKKPVKKPAPAAAPAAAPQATGNADLDAQVAHLRAIRERLSRANTPEERQALMAERNKVMQDAMSIMQKDMMGMGMAGPSKGKGQATPAQMQMCHDMMGQHMAFMQEVMPMMMDNQGMMGGGMGPGTGMGPGGMMGK
ncbi:hypothetical protein BKK81_28070 [Cupriavidus sp. USMAHM13]|uniref:Uncharacterized protein n=1 Tax=Cupriavidus malaysiensis TaxID=367825 RepID=A0ABM6FAA6_9BURK|nr:MULTISPECIES: hypothetical protein [Cupriavidus]AOZ03009.1 hypothetical protein BKK81_28070 [Cupriavidus sp. USMAHM13]AOZ08632.1 hypothetical protein BKK80_22100 [Cupriavidus malaysiensis]